MCLAFSYLVILVILIFINLNEGYLNYVDISYKGSDKNCPKMHAENYKKIRNSSQTFQPFGYTQNYLFDMTRFIKTDEPLPTSPDFFKTI